MLGVGLGPDAGVNHQRQVRPQNAGQILHRLPANRIEIRHIYFREAQLVAIAPCEQRRIAAPIPRNERTPDRFIQFAAPATCMHGQPGLDINDADDAHYTNMHSATADRLVTAHAAAPAEGVTAESVSAEGAIAAEGAADKAADESGTPGGAPAESGAAAAVEAEKSLLATPAIDFVTHAARVRAVIGWDIGGVNTKVARVVPTLPDREGGRDNAIRRDAGPLGAHIAASMCPYEIQRDSTALSTILRTLAAQVGMEPGDVHAVTMTAELSQMFRLKRDGVAFVLDGIVATFAGADVRVYATRGDFLSVSEAREDPLAVAASNWAATARAVARLIPDAVIVDIGTTTTDVVAIVDGSLRALGWTDPERLQSGELLYLGAVRTPVEAITQGVPLAGGDASVSAEGFALAADAHIWRGDLAPTAYTTPTPDGRPTNRNAAGERLARVVCADREMLDDAAVDRIADAIAEAQISRTAAAVARVRSRHPELSIAVVTGVGDFVAAAAAERAGLSVRRLSDMLGADAARGAPAAAVALLLLEELRGRFAVDRPRETPVATAANGTRDVQDAPTPPSGAPTLADRGGIDIVLKIGGALLKDPAAFGRTMEALERLSAGSHVLIVPGGGPFADVVRDVDRAHRIDDDAAHWMAVLAMDQYAELIASRIPHAKLVTSLDAATGALGDGLLPILAPYRWLRDADPLPHSWDVTSDSIAAWVATTCRARELVLLKPVAGPTAANTDPHFARYLGQAHVPSLEVTVCAAADMEQVIGERLLPGRAIRAAASDEMRLPTNT